MSWARIHTVRPSHNLGLEKLSESLAGAFQELSHQPYLTESMCVEHADTITVSISDKGSAHSLINCHRRRKLTHSDSTYDSSTPCIKHTDSTISPHSISDGV